MKTKIALNSVGNPANAASSLFAVISLTLVFLNLLILADGQSQEPPAENLNTEIGDLTTLKGKTYKNCKIKRLDPDGLYVSHSGGIGKIYFSELPKEISEKFGYDPDFANDFAQREAERMKEVHLVGLLQNKIAEGTVKADLRFSTPANLRSELVEILGATHFTLVNGSVTKVTERTVATRTRNALGGEGLPITRTEREVKTKDLGTFFLIGDGNSFESVAGSQVNGVEIYPVPYSDQLIDNPIIYATNRNVAFIASQSVVKVLQNRAENFAEKRFLGANVAEIDQSTDAFARAHFAFENGELIEFEYANSPEAMAVLAICESPYPITVIAICKNAQCHTVLYRATDNFKPITEADAFRALEVSTGKKFEEILAARTIRARANSTPNAKAGKAEEENWIDSFGVTKAFWSEDGEVIALSVASQVRPNSYSVFWATDRHSDALRDIKQNEPEEEWWNEVKQILDGAPPKMYDEDYRPPETIDEFLTGKKNESAPDDEAP